MLIKFWVALDDQHEPVVYSAVVHAERSVTRAGGVSHAPLTLQSTKAAKGSGGRLHLRRSRSATQR